MKAFQKAVFVLTFIGASFFANAQYREIGIVSSASMGIMYGPVLDARPVFKWGKSIQSVRALRIDRTYMNYSTYNGQSYWNISTGAFFGQEWRKSITDKFYLLHGPEVGGYYSHGTNYTSVQPGLRYQLGMLYAINPNLNVGLAAPLSISSTFGKSNGTWNQSSLNVGLFSETNYLILTYAFEKQKK
jgi:hypothetical protein